MRHPVNLFVLFLLASALQASPARAGSEQEGADRFILSFAFRSGVSIQRWEASAESRICRECSFTDSDAMPVTLQPPADGDDLDVTPFVFGSLDLMSPELPLPGSPRLFAGGEFGGAFGAERRVARAGDPSRAGSPTEGGTNFFEDQATGQGTEVIAQYGDLVYSAHAGVAIPFELFGRQFRLRPSVGWTRFEVDVEGRVVDAECESGCNPATPPFLGGPGFLRGVTLSASSSEVFDGVGPGLELEMDTGRFGPLGTSLLLGARAYKVLGDTDFEFDTLVDFPPDTAGDDEYAARFRFEVDDWLYRVAVGFRFHWLGSPR